MAQASAADVKLLMPSEFLERGRSRNTKCTIKGESFVYCIHSSSVDLSSYVEMLELQQAKLVAGLRELFTSLPDWPILARTAIL